MVAADVDHQAEIPADADFTQPGDVPHQEACGGPGRRGPGPGALDGFGSEVHAGRVPAVLGQVDGGGAGSAAEIQHAAR